jgi:hypothetical protein
MTDDHGDQFPDAVPGQGVPTATRPAGAQERLVRMSAAATDNAPVQRPAGRRTPPRSHGDRPATTQSRMGRLTRRSLERFDRYTLDVFNPRPPHALYAPRSHDSA